MPRHRNEYPRINELPHQSNVCRPTGVIIIVAYITSSLLSPPAIDIVHSPARVCASATMAMQTASLLFFILSCWLISGNEGRILSQCDAAKALVAGGVERSFISTYVCIMKSESGFDTRKKTGPGHKASYSYGVFQISSDKWCNAFRPGGICNKNCNDFLNDDIKDDIACAKIIAAQEGFKHWKGWVKSCKNGNLPNVSGCILRRDVSSDLGYGDDHDFEEPDELLTIPEVLQNERQ